MGSRPDPFIHHLRYIIRPIRILTRELIHLLLGDILQRTLHL